MIPRWRSDVTGRWSWFLWAFFGNDDGGLYGEYDHYAAYYAEHGPSLWLAIQWWCRNPAANLFKVVLRSRRETVRVLVQWTDTDGWQLWFARPQGDKWFGSRQFTIAALPIGLVWRLGPTEGYWGFHAGGWLALLPTARPWWASVIVYGLLALAIWKMVA